MMSQLEIKVQVPDFLVDTVDVDKNKFDEYIRQTLAVELYREGKLSLGKAKELAGLSNKWEMIQLLNSRGVCFDYSAKDAEADLDTLDRLLS
jgi:predicted HTH domain antitoxin